MIQCSAMIGAYFLIKALVQRFLYLCKNNTEKYEIMACYWDHIRIGHVAYDDMHKSIRSTVVKLGLAKHGILPSRLGKYSFQEGGAMLLKLAETDCNDIKKIG